MSGPDDTDGSSDGARDPGAGGEGDARQRPDRGRAGEDGGPVGGATATGDRHGDVPDWEDDYLDRVGDRLMHHYDLRKDRAVVGETFDMYGRMEMVSRKHFLHPALSYARHGTTEHLFARRVDGVRVADLERCVELGHELAEEWIDADEEHYGTDFTFALVAPSLSGEVRSFVEGFKERTLIKYGYHGHYEVNLLAVAPDPEEIVASESADVRRAFALWESPEERSPGLLDRLF